MIDIERLGAFYLGCEMDAGEVDGEPPASSASSHAATGAAETLTPLLLDARDLVTHAVCVGMTGSGKTGLCLALLEEAAIDGIPAIAIDPKGDLGNLLLTFPGLSPAEFRPWIDEEEARRASITPDELAAQTAARWKDGLARWGQDGARIARLKSSADCAIYTPGAGHGLPISIVGSLAAPPGQLDADALRDRIAAAASGLLALLGIEADPLRSREHALLSALFAHAWQNNQNLDLPSLVRGIAQPPFSAVGVLDLETFYPARDRMDLSLRVNTLFAAPGFAAWLEGEPLAARTLLYTPEGKPRIAVISLAHLDDAERMFFLTLLLGEVLSWMRLQPGTNSLRALLYMDEIFGYFPPTANPPSKPLMLALLKQARAFGLGIVLSTQNPVDLDYKGLSNAGTWFLGRLQTARDKDRVLEGLEAAGGTGMDRAQVDALLSGLATRRFLLRGVRTATPVLLESRWTLSFLRGPLSRPQIAALMAARKAAAAPAGAAPVFAPSTGARPVLPPGVPQLFLSSKEDVASYRPHLLGVANVHYVAAKLGVDEWRKASLIVPLTDALPPNPWDAPAAAAGAAEPMDPATLQTEPGSGARFAALPSIAAQPKSYAAWSRALVTHIYQSRPLRLWQCAALKQTSKPGESEGDFRLRLSVSGREARDDQVEKLRGKYAAKVQALQDRIRRAEERVVREQAQYQQQQVATAVSAGAALLGAFLGGGRRGEIGRLATTARSAGRAQQQKGDIDAASTELAALQEQMSALQGQITQEMQALQQRSEPGGPPIEECAVAARKADITVERVALLWMA